MAKKKFIPRPPEKPEVIEARWKKKKERLGELSNGIRRLRHNITTDLKSDDEKTFLTALVVSIMDRTGERVGNESSASDGHFGVTGFLKKHISVIGNKVHLSYMGKSGVDHDKSFSDETIAKALKKAIKNSPSKNIFCTSDDFQIRADRVNRFLSDFNISAKDLRGYAANKRMMEKLLKLEPADTEAKRKKQFTKSLKEVALWVGHGFGTLKKHYLIPELPTEFIEHGKVVNIKELGYYKEGGDIEKPEAEEKEFDYEALYNTKEDPEKQEEREKRIQNELDSEQEEEYQKSRFSKKWSPTRKVAIEKLTEQYRFAKNKLGEWESKNYKSGMGKIAEVGMHDDFEHKEFSVDYINQARKQRNIRSYKSDMNEALEDLKKLGLSQQKISEITSEKTKQEFGGHLNEKDIVLWKDKNGNGKLVQIDFVNENDFTATMKDGGKITINKSDGSFDVIKSRKKKMELGGEANGDKKEYEVFYIDMDGEDKSGGTFDDEQKAIAIRDSLRSRGKFNVHIQYAIPVETKNQRLNFASK